MLSASRCGQKNGDPREGIQERRHGDRLAVTPLSVSLVQKLHHLLRAGGWDLSTQDPQNRNPGVGTAGSCLTLGHGAGPKPLACSHTLWARVRVGPPQRLHAVWPLGAGSHRGPCSHITGLWESQLTSAWGDKLLSPKKAQMWREA